MRFEKWHGLGNAYLLVEREAAGTLSAERVRRLCDGDRGIGSDGLLEIVSRDGDRAEIVIWNPDGSIAEMSGNGVRIAAGWLARAAGVGVVTVVTDGREVAARTLTDVGAGRKQEPELEVEIDVGRVEIGAPETLELEDGPVALTPVSVGNPHAVVRVDGATRADLLRIGPALEVHPRFPARTNVQLVEPIGRSDLRVLVWERGAGETASSGSSSTAAAAVAVARGWCESPVTIHLPGGELIVTLDGTNATLRGPVEQICSGDTDL
jgi:diaminopimelate epimerase